MSTDSTIDKSIRLTDMGNAERFVREQGDSVRYCYPWRRWLVWDGQRWKIDDNGQLRRLAKNTVRSIYHEAAFASGQEERQAIARWAQTSERADRVNAMLKMAECEEEIPIAIDELDSQPWLFNCANGTLDLETCELRRHNRGDFLTKMAPVEYPSEEVNCPLWLAFLNRVFDSDRELISYVKRILALSLVGQVFEHVLPIFYGTGANGKSVLIETWLRVLGPDYGIKAPHDLLMLKRNDTHPTERADLFGKRFVAVVESGEGRRLNESLVKELTGGDRLRARRMRQDFWEFTPSHLPVLITNHKPIVRGTDLGIWRRLKLVPFNVTIPENDQDVELVDKLHAEAGHILRWALGGIIEWRQLRLREPDVVKSATDSYRASQDVLKAFIEDACEVDNQLRVKSSELYRQYRLWCDTNGEKVVTQRTFGEAMTERGFERVKSSGKWYVGLSMNGTLGPWDLGTFWDLIPI